MAGLRFRSLLVGALALSLALGTSACTFIGAGVGAVIDPGGYREQSVDETLPLSAGQHVAVLKRNGQRLEGELVQTTGASASDPERYLVVALAEGQVAVPVSDVRAIGIERPGRGWLWGALIGLPLDVLGILLAGSLLNDMVHAGA